MKAAFYTGILCFSFSVNCCLGLQISTFIVGEDVTSCLRIVVINPKKLLRRNGGFRAIQSINSCLEQSEGELLTRKFVLSSVFWRPIAELEDP